jgi:lysozyme
VSIDDYDEGNDPVARVVRRVMPALIAFEGFRAKPYLDIASVPTIGYGSTFYPGGRKVQLSDSPVTKALAYQLAQHSLTSIFIPAVTRLTPMVLSDPRRTAGTTLWVYNCGAGSLQSSRMRRRINEEDWDGAYRECQRWVWARGKISSALVARRQIEGLMILKGVSDGNRNS